MIDLLGIQKWVHWVAGSCLDCLEAGLLGQATWILRQCYKWLSLTMLGNERIDVEARRWRESGLGVEEVDVEKLVCRLGRLVDIVHKGYRRHSVL